jgi:hypothetical protein
MPRAIIQTCDQTARFVPACGWNHHSTVMMAPQNLSIDIHYLNRATFQGFNRVFNVGRDREQQTAPVILASPFPPCGLVVGERSAGCRINLPGSCCSSFLAGSRDAGAGQHLWEYPDPEHGIP